MTATLDMYSEEQLKAADARGRADMVCSFLGELADHTRLATAEDLRLLKIALDLKIAMDRTQRDTIIVHAGISAPELIEALVQAGGCIDGGYSTQAPIAIFAERGLRLAVEQSIKAGADLYRDNIMINNIMIHNPLCCAASNGIAHMVDLLLPHYALEKHGASLDRCLRSAFQMTFNKRVDKGEYLSTEEEKKKADIIIMLIKAGATLSHIQFQSSSVPPIAYLNGVGHHEVAELVHGFLHEKTVSEIKKFAADGFAAKTDIEMTEPVVFKLQPMKLRI